MSRLVLLWRICWVLLWYRSDWMDDSRYMVIEVGISWQQFPWGSWSTRKGKSAKSGTKEECFSASDHCLPNDFASFACLCARPRIYLNWTLLQWSIIYIYIISDIIIDAQWCTLKLSKKCSQHRWMQSWSLCTTSWNLGSSSLNLCHKRIC